MNIFVALKLSICCCCLAKRTNEEKFMILASHSFSYRKRQSAIFSFWWAFFRYSLTHTFLRLLVHAHKFKKGSQMLSYLSTLLRPLKKCCIYKKNYWISLPCIHLFHFLNPFIHSYIHLPMNGEVNINFTLLYLHRFARISTHFVCSLFRSFFAAIEWSL